MLPVHPHCCLATSTASDLVILTDKTLSPGNTNPFPSGSWAPHSASCSGGSDGRGPVLSGLPCTPVLRAFMGEQVSEFPAILSWDLHEQQAGRGAGKVIPQEKTLERKAEAGVGVSVGMGVGTAGTGGRLPGLPIRQEGGLRGRQSGGSSSRGVRAGSRA